MINEKNIKKYASTVLINTVEELFDHNKELIDAFYKDFVKTNKRNKLLKNNYKDNEVVDQLILDELEKSFTRNDIGRVLQKNMVEENDKAIEDLAHILDEKLRPIAYDLRVLFNDNAKYDEFRKLVTENLVVSNLNLNSSAIRALKTMGMTGIETAKIIQLITEIDN